MVDPAADPILLGGNPTLRLESPARDAGGVTGLLAHLTITGALDAQANLYLIPKMEEAQRLAAFLNRMSTAFWTGWEGIEAWESMEHGLSMEWRWRKVGYAEVDVRLTAENQEWSVRAQLQVPSGDLESLGATANALLLVRKAAK